MKRVQLIIAHICCTVSVVSMGAFAYFDHSSWAPLGMEPHHAVRLGLLILFHVAPFMWLHELKTKGK